ncbi:SPW repeat protein [Arthrobacter dokdonensis]|uniref:SPW repeat protein n=1 Tax=Arthrobacter dokdonellae TaxID=2211210 RepID=UPI000DE5C242|nr:SPW repeat protein [Arthrobacter dokdonellae]
MKKWNRWQDYVAIIAGLYAALSTIWTTQQGSSMVLMIGFGVLLIIAGVWNLMSPGTPAVEWAQAVLGALLFISPWIGGYSGRMGAAWTSWIAGGVALIVAVLAVQPSMRQHTVGHDHGLPAH